MIAYTNEQRRAVVDIFSEGMVFYSLKELEAIGTEKGIDSNVLRSVLLDLTANNVIESDKIRSVHLYWLPPKNKFHEDIKKAEELKQKNKELNDKSLAIKKAISQQDRTQGSSSENKERREYVLSQLDILRAEEQALKEFIAIKQHENANEVLALRDNIKSLVVAINRWTDNIFNMKSWFKRRFPALLDENLEKEFNIPPELDYFCLN